MKVTFDTNTYRNVINLDRLSDKPIIQDYIFINKAIQEKKIIPFISETIFTIESLPRKQRKVFFHKYSKSDTVKTSFEENDEYLSINLSFILNEELQLRNNDYLKEILPNAMKLGFKILRVPRVGMITNKDIEACRYIIEDELLLGQYHNKVAEVGSFIREELKAGDYEAFKMAEEYNPLKGIGGIGDAPQSNSLSKAIAEWADGDSVASHIAIGGDYFCTLDEAKGAGKNSIFSKKNKQILAEKYGFVAVNPTELVAILKEIL